jgi:ubiquinone/menaquinone biosynthesis C-methylase UbiE
MSTEHAPGLHVVTGKAVDASAYDRWIGRWSRLFVPSLLAAAQVSPGYTVLDVATGTGEAALAALSIVGSSGAVVGVDIAPEMLEAARVRLNTPFFQPVAADGHALPFRDDSFDAAFCQVGLQFFRDPSSGLREFHRVVRPGAWAAVCVHASPDRAPRVSVLADILSTLVPEQREVLYMSFALGDQARLEKLFASAGFREVRVEREVRSETFEDFDEYWEPIETGVGQLPQTYLALSEPDRRSVREQVRARLAQFETDGKLSMSMEMLIGTGRA